MKKTKETVVGIDKAIRSSILTSRISILLTFIAFLTSFAFAYYIYSNEAGKVFVLDDQGDISSATLTSRSEEVEAEADNHMRMFYSTFFSYDVVNVQENVDRGLELGGVSVRRLWETYKSNNFYNSVRQNNLIIKSSIDSTLFRLDKKPIQALVYGKQEVIRGDFIETRTLNIRCVLKEVSRVKKRNPHGYLIEKLTILDNSVID